MAKKKDKKAPSVSDDDMGINGLTADWSDGLMHLNMQDTIAEEDDEDEDEEDEEDHDESASPARNGNGNRGQQWRQRDDGQQYQRQKGGQQQQQKNGGQQKGKGNQNEMGKQKNQKGQKGQKKGQQQQQDMGWNGAQSERDTAAPGWGTNATNDGEGVVNNDWGPATNDWGQNSGGGGWGDSDGNRVAQHSQPSPTEPSAHSYHSQRRLASLLNQQWPASGVERGRTNNHQEYGQGRTLSAAEHVRAAANGRTPSRTLLYAATGSGASVLDGGARGGQHTTEKFHDSGRAALEPAGIALYSRHRPARERIYWMFSPTKDERVASLLAWVQAMSHGLATIGVHKFLQTQQRGALIANADYRPWNAPNEPAFDWMVFGEIVDTHDRTLQESMAFYDPESQVLVFVFLLSRSRNSLAMWRRKLAVPNMVRQQNRKEIARITKKLAEEKLVITVDELPSYTQPKAKRKWFNVRW